MTAPASDFAARLRTAASAIGSDKPAQALTLASSDLSTPDMNLVGNFTQGLETQALVRLARQSGARTNLTPDQLSQMSALGEPTQDVNTQKPKDTRNWLERVFGTVGDALANTGSFLSDLPGVHQVFTGLSWLNSVAHLPARLISSGIDSSNNNEVDAAMRAHGYDPGNAFSYIAFMTNHGDALYHDLDGLRQTYGDQKIDLAMEMQNDPTKFAASLATKDAATQALVRTPEFAKVADMVDRQHISPGRDLARLITFGHTQNAAFTALSGALDGAYTLLLDPTLMAGKVATGVRALDSAGQAIHAASAIDRFTGVAALTRGVGSTSLGRYFGSGIRDAMDIEGIRQLLATHPDGQAITRAGRGIQEFLGKVEAFDNAAPGVERDAIFARLQAEHRDLMPLFDEVRGKRVLAPSAQAAWKSSEDNQITAGDLLALKGVHEALNPPPPTLTGTQSASVLTKGTPEGWVVRVKPASGKGSKQAVTMHVNSVNTDASGYLTIRGKQPVKGGYSNSANSVTRYVHGDEQIEVIRAPKSALPEPTAVTPDVPLITDAAPAAPGFEHKLTDVNGVGWVATNAEPIRTLDDFADYFASTAGLLRMAGGAAAKRELILPGRIALRQRLAGINAEKRQLRVGARNDVVYDHSRPYAMMPHESEEVYQQQLDDVARLEASGAIDSAEAARRGDLIYQEIRGKAGFIAKQRAKFEQRGRRISGFSPSVKVLDLTSADSLEQVRRFGRMYMNKAEADRLTAAFAAGDLGTRRAVAHAMVEQTMHASGLSRSEAGLAEMEKYRTDQATLDQQAYGLSGTDVISTPAGDRHVALLPSQLSDKVLLPDFQSLQFMATKHVVGGRLTRLGSMRSYLTGEGADHLMAPIKMGMITTPAGGVRNALDEVAGLALRGEGHDLARGRAMFSKATADASATGAEAQRAARLQTRFLASIPRSLRGLPRKVDDVLLARGLGKLMSYGRPIDEKSIKYTRELQDMQRNELLDENIVGAHHGDGLMTANNEALAMHKSGLMAKPVTYNGTLVKHEFAGYRQVEIDGGLGLSNLADNLGLAFQDLTSPAHVALKGIVEGRDALRDVVEYMQTPPMRHFLANAEVFKFTRDGKAAITAEQKMQAIERYSENLIAHTTMLVSGRGQLLANADEAAGAAARYENDITQSGWWDDPEHVVGPINSDLADMLLKGDIPDRTWLKENLTPEQTPSHAIGKQYVPVNPKHMVGAFTEGYTAMMARAYRQVVEKPIQAIARNPMLTVAYEQARRNLAPYEKALKEAGFTDENALAVVQRSALTQAEHLVAKSIDNPVLATQYEILSRNFHMFSRAQMDWLRRWGRSIRDNPQQIQRGQLYLHGAESAGIVEKDDQGNLVFTYPGSGAIITMLGKLTSKIPGMPDMAKIPVVPDLTSQLMFLNPSLDNPIGFSASPLVSIPFDALSAMTGSDHALLKSSMDRAINGQLGAGRTWYEKILPAWASRIISGSLNTEDPASQYASAFTSALTNLEAAGRLDSLDGTDPTAIARFQSDLKAQISNQMVMRAVMGFFLPASPSVPNEDVKSLKTGESVLKPDFAFEKAGLANLKDEARQIFGTMPYDKALVWWAQNHPGELVYQVGKVPRTKVGDTKAQAPATITAAKWMQDNPYLIDNYGRKGGVATYFMPQGTGSEGDFSMDAYRAQLENGIREYVPLNEFFTNIVTQRGEDLYFSTKDDVDKARAAAIASGNTAASDQIDAWWADKKQLIMATNPLLAAKFAEFATSGIAQSQTIAQLNQLLADPRAVKAIGIDQAGGVADMLLAQQNYMAQRQQVLGQRGYYATTARQAAQNDYEATVASVVQRFPGLGDLARGAFRTPN